MINLYYNKDSIVTKKSMSWFDDWLKSSSYLRESNNFKLGYYIGFCPIFFA
jgi:hypothetical protein